MLCATAGFCIGAWRYLRPGKALYAYMIVLGVGCIALGRLFNCVGLCVGADAADRFQIGSLGAAGAFSFFFSANYGQIDSLADAGERSLRRYRVAAWAGPLVIALLYAFIVFSSANAVVKAACGVVAAAIAAASYYHVKHFLIPDVEGGIIRSMRGFNACALCLGIACMAEMTAYVRKLEPLLYVSGALVAVLSLIIVPVMDRGVKRWTA